jgi:hypothetical protein
VAAAATAVCRCCRVFCRRHVRRHRVGRHRVGRHRVGRHRFRRRAEGAGFEPARGWTRPRVSNPAPCLSVNPPRAVAGSRTPNLRVLNATPLPVGLRRRTGRVSGRIRTAPFRVLDPAPLPVGLRTRGAAARCRTGSPAVRTRGRRPCAAASLPEKDSNLHHSVQSRASCHWTIRHRLMAGESRSGDSNPVPRFGRPTPYPLGHYGTRLSQESNLVPPDSESGALSGELQRHGATRTEYRDGVPDAIRGGSLRNRTSAPWASTRCSTV